MLLWSFWFFWYSVFSIIFWYVLIENLSAFLFHASFNLLWSHMRLLLQKVIIISLFLKLAYVQKMSVFDRNVKSSCFDLRFSAFLWTHKCLMFTAFVMSREETRFMMFDVGSFCVAYFCAMLGNILMQFFWVTNVTFAFLNGLSPCFDYLRSLSLFSIFFCIRKLLVPVLFYGNLCNLFLSFGKHVLFFVQN